MPPIVKKLGFIKAIHSSTTAPSNTKMLWYDENIGVPATDRLKYFNADTSTWTSIVAGGGGVPAITLNKFAIGDGVGITETTNIETLNDDIYGIRDLLVDRDIYIRSTAFGAALARLSYEGNPTSVHWKIPENQPEDKFLKSGPSGSVEELVWADVDNWSTVDLTLGENRSHDLDIYKLTWMAGAYTAMEYQTGASGVLRLMQDDTSRQMGFKKDGANFEVGVFDSGGNKRGAFLMNETSIGPHRKMLHENRARVEHKYASLIVNGGQPTISLQGAAVNVVVGGDQANLDWGFGTIAHESNTFSKGYIRIDNTGGYALGFVANRWQMSNGVSAPTLGTGVHWLEVVYDPISVRMVILNNIEIATDI